MNNASYLEMVKQTQASRMQWWHEARFGMFVHWGLYSQLARHEWAMNRERIPRPDYEKLADAWKPKPNAARDWAALAKKAGMKYMVMTTKHHEGFCLWDSKTCAFNAVNHGPGRDLVREYVEAARESGLKVGFYYSLMDWHHPDGHACARDEAARRRFVAYTHALVKELCSNYGRVDILWYDVSWPLSSPEAWESHQLNAMVRELQPHILINDRSQIPEDFGTPEEHITAAEEGRSWEACMTFNGAWGWQPCPPEDWLSARRVLDMLRQVTAGTGNLLLNIGPKPDGSVPKEATDRLTVVGNWLDRYGNAVVYGKIDRLPKMEWMPTGAWSRRGNTLYYWCSRWPGRELAIGGLRGRLENARLLPDGKPLPFTQDPDRLVIRGLPVACPEKEAQVAVLALQFDGVPSQHLGAGYEAVSLPEPSRPVQDGKWSSPYIGAWQLSLPMPKRGPLAKVECVSLKDKLGWTGLPADKALEGFANAHGHFPQSDGIVWFGCRVKVGKAGNWLAHLGHDGGARMFLDGKEVYRDPKRIQPALPDRARFPVRMKKGTHEIQVAMDLDHGRGWGIFLNFSIPEEERTGIDRPVFPEVAGSSSRSATRRPTNG